MSFYPRFYHCVVVYLVLQSADFVQLGWFFLQAKSCQSQLILWSHGAAKY